MREALSLRQTVRDWRTWVPIIVWLAAGIAAAQVLLHDLFTGLPVFWYRLASGALQAVLVLVPASLYVVWRHAAERERRALEELQATQQMREDLIAMLVHDLKSPAISAGMALDMLLEESRTVELLDRDDLEMVIAARRNLRRLERMVADALEVAAAQERPLKLKLAPGDLCAAAAEVVEDSRPQADRNGLTLELKVDRALPRFAFDADKIRRVLDNLVSNAIAHTPAGGRVRVEVARNGAEAQVTVADSGEGISEELREWVFEKYAQGDPARHQVGSVGLGLAFCRLAVEAHGGRIRVEPSEWGGSAFTFTLPIRDAGDD